MRPQQPIWGSIDFLLASSAESISVAGVGDLIGEVYGAGSSVTINPQSSGSTLTVGAISANAGAVTLTTNGAGSQIVIPTASTIATTPTGTDISLQSATVNNAGTVTSQRDLILTTDTLVNSGSMTNGRDLDISTFTAGNALNINGSFALPLTAVRNINLGYNNPSQITVTGVPMTAGNDISLNGGTNSVTLTTTALGGTVIGGGAGNLAGSSVSITESSGGFTVGALNSPGSITLTDTDNTFGHGGISIVGALASTGSSVSLTSGALSAVSVTAGGSITTIPGGTDVSLAAHVLTNAGSITSNRDLTLLTDSIINSGTVTTSRDLNIGTFTVGTALNITGSFPIPLTAARNINLGYNNASQINVTGAPSTPVTTFPSTVALTQYPKIQHNDWNSNRWWCW